MTKLTETHKEMAMSKTLLRGGKVLAFGLGLAATVAFTPQAASALDMFFAGL